mgnify:FL=1
MSSSREQQLEEANVRLQQENKLLQQKIDLLLQRAYGQSSEKVSPDQLDFLMNNPEALGKPASGDSPKTEEAAAKPKQRRRKRKPRLPEYLPIESSKELIPQEVLDSPEHWKRIGQEITEQLHYHPGHFSKKQLIRPKYVSLLDRDAPPIIAPLPNQWTERGIATPGLQAHIAIGKYVDHLPLYRQEQIFKTRYGVHIPRNTMSRWMDQVAQSLKLIYLCMAEQLFTGDYLQVDETPIKYLKPGSGKAQQGYFWCYSNPKGDVIYDWQTSRGHECLLHMLQRPNQTDPTQPTLYYRGILQCDGYSAYETLARKVPAIQLAGCMAHVRRKFKEALQHSPTQALWIIVQIKHLYRIERKLSNQNAGPRYRNDLRQVESRPILARIKKALLIFKANASILPQSTLGRAVDYALGQWEGLEVYLTEGRVEIDNNHAENSVRPTAVGKKNWLFIGRGDTGDRSAIIYSIVESCRRRGIDPHAYLADVLERIPSATNKEVSQLTPAAWAAEKQDQHQAAA